MSKIWLILMREISVKIKTVWFWLIPAIIPLFFVLIVAVTIAFTYFTSVSANDRPIKIQVVDSTPAQLFGKSLKDSPKLDYSLTTDTLTTAKAKIQDKPGEFVLSVTSSVNNKIINYNSQLFGTTNPKGNIQLNIQGELSAIKLELDLKRTGLSGEVLDSLNQGFHLETVTISKEGTEKSNLTSVAFGLSYVIAIGIYFLSTVFGTQIMISILEEKSSRVVEVLLSAVKPYQLLIGKILGQFALISIQAVTTIVASVVIGIISLVIGIIIFIPGIENNLKSINFNQIASGSSQVTSTSEFRELENTLGLINSILTANSGWLLVLFFVYFLIGITYSAIWFAAIGASSDNYQSASNSSLSWFVSLPTLLGVIFLPNIASDSNTVIAKFLSIFPFTSYIVMPARLALGVSKWEVALSLGCSLIGLAISFWVCGKIYRVGLLMYGKKPSIAQIFKWVLS
ncbi:MAG: ABC transporter permease [Candidatus Parcubacteria bacterium]|nr:ABC transporter permease [Candidatus Paceibacterota bacterium]